ncbi:hypothetical protein CBR_g31394 [Chara braunii]|uniref:Smr domain-containing protein n=1 Tax=Chara braunii TaxID=69332 RepID=A0A388LEV7_CHABU|nr:hypothetical protein CBR_g31394 [Chara braunii]|eukprot:GBG80838.1 hypothetical protein CBR_g31394 [Chara braunii]
MATAGVLPAAKLTRSDGGLGLSGLFLTSCRDGKYGRDGFHPSGSNSSTSTSTSTSRSKGLIQIAPLLSSSSSCCSSYSYSYSCPSYSYSYSCPSYSCFSYSFAYSSPLSRRCRETRTRVSTVLSSPRDLASCFVCFRRSDGDMNVDVNVDKFSTAGCRRQWRWCDLSRLQSGAAAMSSLRSQAGLTKGERGRGGGGRGGGGGGGGKSGGRRRRIVAMAVMDRFSMERMIKVGPAAGMGARASIREKDNARVDASSAVAVRTGFVNVCAGQSRARQARVHAIGLDRSGKQCIALNLCAPSEEAWGWQIHWRALSLLLGFRRSSSSSSVSILHPHLYQVSDPKFLEPSTKSTSPGVTFFLSWQLNRRHGGVNTVYRPMIAVNGGAGGGDRSLLAHALPKWESGGLTSGSLDRGPKHGSFCLSGGVEMMLTEDECTNLSPQISSSRVGLMPGAIGGGLNQVERKNQGEGGLSVVVKSGKRGSDDFELACLPDGNILNRDDELSENGPGHFPSKHKDKDEGTASRSNHSGDSSTYERGGLRLRETLPVGDDDQERGIKKRTSDKQEHAHARKTGNARVRRKGRLKGGQWLAASRQRTGKDGAEREVRYARQTKEYSPIVEEVLLKARKYPVRDILAKLGRQLSQSQAMDILKEFQRTHNWHCTLQVFEWMKKQPWHRPNARTYTSLIGFMGREGKIELAVRLFEDMLAANCEPDHYTYTALINGYGKSRMFAEALAVFEHMKESAPGCNPNTVTCNALIDALCKGGRYDEAESIFWDMRKGKGGLGPHCAPNAVTYNTIIRALCNEGQIKAAVAMLEEMKQGELGGEDCQPNVVTYNILVDACGKAGMHDKAQQLFDDMKQRGLQPDQITYTALLDAYGKAGIHEQAERTFKEMQSAACVMDVLVYTALIDAYGKSGFHERAEDLFFKMEVAGIQPNKVTYLSMIDAYGKAGLHAKAEQIFKSMQDAGFEPTLLTYSSLINAYGKAGLYREAATIFCNMQSAGCQPNLITYAALLSACGRDPDWEKAMTVMDALLHSGQEIELALCSLIIGIPKWRDYDEVDEDEENEKEKDTGVWKRAEKMFSIVRGHSVMAKRSFFNALIDVLWFFKLRGRAKRVLAAAREIGAYPEDCCVFGDDVWTLDLHKLSIGAALTLLMTWMAELQLALEWGAEVPNTVRVITGWGRHSRSGESAVKVAVEECVSELGLPFRVIRGNEGSFLASGKALHKWLLSDKAASALILQDEEIAMPRKGYNADRGMVESSEDESG